MFEVCAATTGGSAPNAPITAAATTRRRHEDVADMAKTSRQRVAAGNDLSRSRALDAMF
jgi:hypothetical protein